MVTCDWSVIEFSGDALWDDTRCQGDEGGMEEHFSQKLYQAVSTDKVREFRIVRFEVLKEPTMHT